MSSLYEKDYAQRCFMQYKELRTEEEIYKVLKDHFHEEDPTKAPPLYHGTDESLIALTRKEREDINKACETVMYSVFDQIIKRPEVYFDNPEYPDIDMRSAMYTAFVQSIDNYGSSYLAYRFALNRRNEVPKYQYGDFYVATWADRAIDYSLEAWIYGETGWITNRLVEGAKEVGIALPTDPEFIEAYKIFDERKQQKKSPVVLIITDCDISRVFMEYGAELDLFEREILKDPGADDSYRLSYPEKITDGVYMVKEEHYPELKRIGSMFS